MNIAAYGAEPRSVGLWVGFRAAYLAAYHAGRMMRVVVRVSVRASISVIRRTARALRPAAVISIFPTSMIFTSGR